MCSVNEPDYADETMNWTPACFRMYLPRASDRYNANYLASRLRAALGRSTSMRRSCIHSHSHFHPHSQSHSYSHSRSRYLMGLGGLKCSQWAYCCCPSLAVLLLLLLPVRRRSRIRSKHLLAGRAGMCCFGGMRWCRRVCCILVEIED